MSGAEEKEALKTLLKHYYCKKGARLTEEDVRTILRILSEYGATLKETAFLINVCAGCGKLNPTDLYALAKWRYKNSAKEPEEDPEEPFLQKVCGILKLEELTHQDRNTVLSWKEAYPEEDILEACRITAANAKAPSTAYADKVLKNRGRKDRKKKKGNTFTDFQQREYDYDSLERQLLRKPI